MNYSPYIIDGFLLLVLIWCAVRAYSDGFFTSVIKLVGNLGGLIIAWLLAKNYSIVIFDRFVRDKLTAKALAYLQSATDTTDLQSVIGDLLGSFPRSLWRT
ncbi:MAG: CvpA family protein [Oscillospiraceae bacterium]